MDIKQALHDITLVNYIGKKLDLCSVKGTCGNVETFALLEGIPIPYSLVVGLLGQHFYMAHPITMSSMLQKLILFWNKCGVEMKNSAKDGDRVLAVLTQQIVEIIKSTATEDTPAADTLSQFITELNEQHLYSIKTASEIDSSIHSLYAQD